MFLSLLYSFITCTWLFDKKIKRKKFEAESYSIKELSSGYCNFVIILFLVFCRTITLRFTKKKYILFSSEILSNKSFCWFLSVMFENQQIENSIFSHHRKKWIRLNAIFLKEWIRKWGHLFDKLNPMKLTFLERRDSVKDAIFWQRGFDKDAIVWKSGFKKKGAVFWMSEFDNEAIFWTNWIRWSCHLFKEWIQ